MQIVLLQPVPSQQVKTTLGGQDCQIDVRQRRTASRSLAGGDLMFADTQGTEDPSYTGLGGRFSLAYLNPADAVP